MSARKNTRRFRLGYSGCGTDLIVFALLGAAAIWGILHWNGLTRRPLGLPRVPIPRAVQNFERAIGRWLPHRAPSSPSTPGPSATVAPRGPTSSPSAVPTPASATPPPADTVAPTPIPTVPTPTASVAPSSPPSPATPSAPRAEVAAKVSSVTPEIRSSPNPLSAAASTLSRYGSLLILGLPDGGIAIRDTSAKAAGGTTVHAPGVTGQVRALTVAEDGSIWWLAGSDTRVIAFQPKGKTLRIFDLTPLGPGIGKPNGVAVVRGTDKTLTLTITGSGSPLYLNCATGVLIDLTQVLPAELGGARLPNTALFFSTPTEPNAPRALLTVRADPASPAAPATLALWTSPAAEPGHWTSRALDAWASPAYNTLRLGDSGGSSVALTPDRLAILTKAAGGQTLAADRILTGRFAGGKSADVATVPEGVFGLWAASERVACAASGVWWTFGGTVFNANPDTGATEAYLPWNGAGDEKRGRIAALLADFGGAWVATDTGVHRILLGHPATGDGYGGYLRVRLGADAAHVPSAPQTRKLDALAKQWQGTPYKWGGDSRAGIDCSGYVCALYGGVGITVPRATSELANGNEGQRVRDELRYGDVLVFPGHCAMYLGNGWTTEALDAGVGKAAIWSRRNVIVRRFLR